MPMKILLIGCESSMNRKQSLLSHSPRSGQNIISLLKTIQIIGYIKLTNKDTLLQSCKYRGMDTEELWRYPQRDTASICITHASVHIA